MKVSSRVAAMAAGALLVIGGGCVRRPGADLVLVGGRVYTMNPARPVAEAVCVRMGRIRYVGSTAEARRWVGPSTRVLELNGLTVLPGLIDAHGHLAGLGRTSSQLDVVGTLSRQEVRVRVLAKQRESAPGEWILGRGWDQNDWPVKTFPTGSDLAGTEANPVYLRRVDGHAIWVNRTALERAGITRETPDPEGGRIVRDETGAPTGVLVDAAISLVTEKIPEPTRAQRMQWIERATRECARYGLTGVHDAGTTREELGIYRELLAKRQLHIRVYAMLDSDDREFVLQEMVKGPVSEGDNRLTVRAVKVYADGALGSRGAALLEPYTDAPDQRGLFQHSRETMEAWARQALLHRFQMCVHAIGDAGNRRALDVYATVISEQPGVRFRIEHAQVLALEDIPRFAALGVIASMQPTHATSDMYWAERRVGPERIRGAYAWRKLIDSGAVIACGSDFPVESANPLWGIYAAVTRQDLEGWPAGGWRPEERMTREEALAGFTRNAAYAEFAENVKGSLEVGKLADFTIVDRDIMAVPVSEIPNAAVVYTIVGGEIIFAPGRTAERAAP